jgi:hypothetical protein
MSLLQIAYSCRRELGMNHDEVIKSGFGFGREDELRATYKVEQMLKSSAFVAYTALRETKGAESVAEIMMLSDEAEKYETVYLQERDAATCPCLDDDFDYETDHDIGN